MGRSRSGGRSWGLLGGVAGAFVLASMSCGGMESTDPGAGGATDGTTAESGLRRRHAPPPPSQPPPPTNTGGSSGGGATSGGTSADAIIKAAQTPDGEAIPQAAGPNGACPAVVQLLGFW